MAKGIAVEYIIAIVLGVVVLGLIGFFFFREGGIFSGVADEQTCKARLISYCSSWSMCNYESDCKPSQKDFYDKENSPECGPIKQRLSQGKGIDESVCKQILRQTTISPPSSPPPNTPPNTNPESPSQPRSQPPQRQTGPLSER